MKSLWSQTVNIEEREKLTGDIRAKNVVIGAGIAGILIAYLLQEKGQEVIVLEAKTIASGQTKNTTAKITSQHGLIYSDMLKNAGRSIAKSYALANEDAIKEYKRIITKEGIACHFEELPSFLFSTEEKGVDKLIQEAEVAKELGIKAEYVDGKKIEELPFDVKGAVRFDGQAQFHPLEFIQQIAKKLTIYEHAKVLEVDGHFVITNQGVVVADNVIFATHYPFSIVPGFYFLRQHQDRSFVLALNGKGVPDKLDGMYYGIDEEVFSFRMIEGKLLFGGGGRRTGKQNSMTEGFCYLTKKANEFYPEAEEVARWSAQDCMPHDRIPFIGKFSLKQDNWYVATGFQKWGMTTAMVAAMVLSDKITKKRNPYEDAFTPQRFLLKAGMKNFFVDVWESVAGLTKGLFVQQKRVCSHMGCALQWNEEEKTWDCACHGSRYDENGRLIDNPAQKNIESKETDKKEI